MNSPVIRWEKAISEILPESRIGIFTAMARVMDSGKEIRQLSDTVAKRIRANYSVEDIRSIELINQTRNAYRKTGKDPARYRPSAEALCRRIAGGKSLYPVSNIVDLLNLISVESGFSIGGYDRERIEGEISVGIGKENEVYGAIGRGNLNIAGLPVLRDNRGAFGSPTSDSVRTRITGLTTEFMMVFFDFEGRGPVEETLQKSAAYFSAFSEAKDIFTTVLKCS